MIMGKVMCSILFTDQTTIVQAKINIPPVGK